MVCLVLKQLIGYSTVYDIINTERQPNCSESSFLYMCSVAMLKVSFAFKLLLHFGSVMCLNDVYISVILWFGNSIYIYIFNGLTISF